MLVFSMLMGIIHLFAGLAMKAYQYAKQKAWLDILYDVGFWYMLLAGLVVFALSNQMFVGILQLSFILPVLAGTIGIAVAGIGAVGILLTAGRESRSPFKRLLKGAYGLYGVTGYLSDILSYSRLLALGYRRYRHCSQLYGHHVGRRYRRRHCIYSGVFCRPYAESGH